MSQFQWSIIDPNVVSGTQLANLLNNGESALHSQHLGSIQPLYAVDGMIWVDDSDPALWQVNQVEGGASIPLWQINTATNTAIFPGAGGTAIWGGITGNIANQIDLQNSLALRLALTGGTMTGTLNMSNNKIGGVATPTVGTDAANKTYVDASGGAAIWGGIVGTLSNQGDLWTELEARLKKTGGTMTGELGIDNTTSLKFVGATGLEDIKISTSNFLTATNLNFNPGNDALASYFFNTGGGESVIMAGGNIAMSQPALQVNSAVRKGEADADYATKASEGTAVWGSITGTLSNQTDLQNALNAKLNLTGGTMTGALSMGGSKITNLANPTATGDAARKAYVDTRVLKTGDTMTGDLTVPALIATGVFANAGIFANATIGSFGDNAWFGYNNGGGTTWLNMTGSNTGVTSLLGLGVERLTLNDKIVASAQLDMTSNKIINLPNPTASNDATRKSYVDSGISTATANLADKSSGSTQTFASAVEAPGFIAVGGQAWNVFGFLASAIFSNTSVSITDPPTDVDHATRKDYVDAKTWAASAITSGTLADARIPNLNASKTTAGTFADARIPSLATSKITSGTFANARISSSSITQYTAALYVGLTGTQTVNGLKTFASRANFTGTLGVGLTNLQGMDFAVQGQAHFGDSTAGVRLLTFLGSGIVQSNNRAATGLQPLALQGSIISFTATTGEAMRIIDDAGVSKVGIGIDAPVAPLHVYRSTNTIPAVIETDQTTAKISFRASGSSSASQVFVGANANDLELGAGGSAKAILTSGSRLGVGLTAPLQTIDANGHIRARSSFLAGNGSNTLPSYTFGGDTDTGMRRAAANTLSFITAGAERGRVSSAGFWGINNTAPIAPLHVGSGSGRAWSKAAQTTAIIEGSGITGLSIIAGGSANYSELNFGDTAVEIRGAVKYNHSTEAFVYSVNGAFSYQMQPTNFRPNSSNAFDLGASAARWRTVYANNALNTSDAAEKNSIKGLPDGMAERLLRTIGPVSYRWNHEGKKAKTNFGFIAQTVAKALNGTGRDPEDYGMLHVGKPDEVLGDTWGLDYTQVTPLLTDVVVQLLDRIEELEKWRSNSKQ